MWGEALRTNKIEVCATKELERVLPDLSISMGGVRRIMGTPMPFAVSYNQFTSQNLRRIAAASEIIGLLPVHLRPFPPLHVDSTSRT